MAKQWRILEQTTGNRWTVAHTLYATGPENAASQWSAKLKQAKAPESMVWVTSDNPPAGELALVDAIRVEWLEDFEGREDKHWLVTGTLEVAVILW